MHTRDLQTIYFAAFCLNVTVIYNYHILFIPDKQNNKKLQPVQCLSHCILTCLLCSSVVWTAINQVTSMSWWSRHQFINIILSTVDNFDVIWPVTTIIVPMVTHRPDHFAMSNNGMGTIHPTCRMSSTSVCRYTWSCYFSASSSTKSVPPRQTAITIKTISGYWLFVPAGLIQPCVRRALFMLGRDYKLV